ncbi:hypothetical protein FI667_g13321, partial [Globisporangium splendens]
MNLFTICTVASFATFGFASAACPVDKILEANKALVRTALDATFNQHDVSAVDRYFGPEYLQHNPFAPDGMDSMKAFIATLTEGQSYQIGAVSAEGDLVWSHNRIPNGNASIAVDIYRVKDGKIVEHWDIVQTEVPVSQTVSGRPMFPITQTATPASVAKGCSDTSGSSPCVTKEVLQANKVVAAAALDGLFNRRDLSAVDRYFGTTYLQHNPFGSDGPEALKALISSLPAATRYEIGAQIADGDLVWNHSRVSGLSGLPASIVVDVFRVQDGKIVEHWDVLQAEVTETVSGRPMFPIVAWFRAQRIIDAFGIANDSSLAAPKSAILSLARFSSSFAASSRKRSSREKPSQVQQDGLREQTVVAFSKGYDDIFDYDPHPST